MSAMIAVTIADVAIESWNTYTETNDFGHLLQSEGAMMVLREFRVRGIVKDRDFTLAAKMITNARDAVVKKNI
jgi:hypothetical protein